MNFAVYTCSTSQSCRIQIRNVQGGSRNYRKILLCHVRESKMLPKAFPVVVLSQHNTTGSDVTSSNPYSPATYGARDVTSGGIVLRRNKGLTLTPGGTTTGSDVTIHVQAYKCLVVINTIVS